jgi:hypothetical protein
MYSQSSREGQSWGKMHTQKNVLFRQSHALEPVSPAGADAVTLSTG